MHSRLVALVGAAALLASIVVLPAAAHSARSTATTTVKVTAGKPSELRFTLSTKTVKKGTVIFKVTNKGSLPHDFKIAGKKTPNIAHGKTATLKVVFKKAGKYTYECAVPGHAAAGMKGVLTVK